MLETGAIMGRFFRNPHEPIRYEFYLSKDNIVISYRHTFSKKSLLKKVV